MSALRAAVIGLGKQAQEYHLPALVNSEQFKLVAVCDIESDRASKVGETYGVPAYSSAEDLLAAESFDVALLVLPHFAYLPTIKLLASSGKHVIKEKPFATSIAEARELLETLKASQVYLGVTVQRRFNPIYRAFLQLRRQIGKIYSIEGVYAMNVENPDYGWRAYKHMSGGGALVDMGYHFIDLLIWYFGLPTSVTARMTRGNRPGRAYDVEDTVHLLFDYPGDNGGAEKTVGSFIISRVYPRKEERVTAFGTQGVIEVSRGLIRRLDLVGKEVERLERIGGWPSAAIEQLDHFAERIRAFRPGDLPDYGEHLKHVAVIEAAYTSDRLGISCQPAALIAHLVSPSPNTLERSCSEGALATSEKYSYG
jgi:predicted dehydrogenase